ncbi:MULTISPECIES: ABC transporter permease [unclassified Rhizobium]|uniref:ABC transporter permease n=1 Tax=unclassified Rhizobium TaxID=2613769 RepID=UPI001160736E|nr:MULTISPECIES: ABC transporter permease [unclassified Rhizobium]TQX84485.1 ABC transporter permease [Rhizobium sp. rho-13.1]TQY08167.1 ABC transporter permease [Rhizobium sp. rho-1.1]
MTIATSRVYTWLRDPLAIAIAASIALLIIGELLSPGFARGDQIIRLLTVAAILGIVAAGQNIVILGGREGIDLSVGAMISFGAVLAGNMMNGQNSGILLAVVVGAAVPALIGIVNGIGITFVRIPPLVMTLGMTAVIQGGLVVYSQGVPSGAAAPMLAQFINQPLVFGIPGILFVWVLIAALMLFVLRRTAFGFAVYAIGSNERAASLVGLPVPLIRTMLYGLSGLFAGLTGVCVIGYTGTSIISVGDQYVLPSVIAVVIGGTSLAGGAGGYLGTMAGAVALTILQSVLITLNLDVWSRQVIFGATLLALMLLYGRQKQLRI